MLFLSAVYNAHKAGLKQNKLVLPFALLSDTMTVQDLAVFDFDW